MTSSSGPACTRNGNHTIRSAPRAGGDDMTQAEHGTKQPPAVNDGRLTAAKGE